MNAAQAIAGATLLFLATATTHAQSSPCETVSLTKKLLAPYQLQICPLPETKRHEYPTEFRVSKDGIPWLTHTDVAGPTGGYNSRDTVRVQFEGQRFVALRFASDDVGTESILVLDLLARQTKEVACPAFHCGSVRALSEKDSCSISVACKPCVEATARRKTKIVNEDLCALKRARASALPWDVPVEGSLVHTQVLEDKQCEGLAVFSSKRTESKSRSNVFLYADYYSDRCQYTTDGKPKIHRVRRVQDKVTRCRFDNTTAFDQRAFGVTDLDGDGHSELTFAYRLICASDEGPARLKLVLLEGDKKYIIRGRTHSQGWSGKRAPGAALKKAPKVFQTHMDKLWNELAPHEGFRPATP